jgi:hypothetical protein
MKCPFCIKKCTECGKLLVAYSGNFTKHKGGKWGLQSKCINCRKKESKQWRNRNKNHIKEYEKKRNATQERKMYMKNREGYRRQWYLNNPEKHFNRHNRRRNKLENQGRGITKEQWLEMMEYFDFKCAYSKKVLDKNNRTVDHIICLDNGGLNEPWNCVPMFRPYNSSKNTKNIEEWYIQQDFFSEERLEKIYAWCEYAWNKWGYKEEENIL